MGAGQAGWKGGGAGAQRPLGSQRHPHGQAGVLSASPPRIGHRSLLHNESSSLRRHMSVISEFPWVRPVLCSASGLQARRRGSARFLDLGPPPELTWRWAELTSSLRQDSGPVCLLAVSRACARLREAGCVPGHAAPSQASRRVPRLGLKGLV